MKVLKTLFSGLMLIFLSTSLDAQRLLSSIPRGTNNPTSFMAEACDNASVEVEISTYMDYHSYRLLQELGIEEEDFLDKCTSIKWEKFEAGEEVTELIFVAEFSRSETKRFWALIPKSKYASDKNFAPYEGKNKIAFRQWMSPEGNEFWRLSGNLATCKAGEFWSTEVKFEKIK